MRTGRRRDITHAAAYQVWLRFLCDHRLTGEAELQIDTASLWHATLADLICAVKPAILDQFPYISDSIDYITIEEIRVLTN
jgi:hypothetical protein